MTTLADIVAGPETTEYVIVPDEFDVAATGKAASPYM
jgi:hypothetical protein